VAGELPHILVVDDEERIRSMLARYFEGEGFRVSLAQDGATMRERMVADPADVVFLDVVLPGEDGLVLARELRAASDVGIIMLTGRGDVVDRVVGIEVGADDYIAKPFHLREVLARTKSVLRRLKPAARVEGTEPSDEPTARFDGWRLDFSRRRLSAPDGKDVPLTTGEFNLMTVFVRHAGRVLDRDQIMDLTRGREWDAFDRSIDAQVARLRKKIEHDAKSPKLIQSVRGVGYVFTAKVEH
jgi:two-component system phosphate regulon response regulator OmpR